MQITIITIIQSLLSISCYWLTMAVVAAATSATTTTTALAAAKGIAAAAAVSLAKATAQSERTD